MFRVEASPQAPIEPTPTAWRAERQKTSLNLGGRVADLREVLNAVLYVNRTGIAWRYLPHDFPAHTTVFSHFSAWTADGTIEKLGVRLHRLVREPAPQPPTPRSPRPGSTPATRTRRSNTAPNSASTSTSHPGTHRSKASPCSHDAG